MLVELFSKLHTICKLHNNYDTNYILYKNYILITISTLFREVYFCCSRQLKVVKMSGRAGAKKTTT